MGELRNCPTCNAVFSFNGLREVCSKCNQLEEDMFTTVYHFLRKRENRAATIERIVEVTGVTDKLLHKWVRKRRLQPAQFPGIGYPCDSCGTLINTAKLCKNCQESIKNDLELHESNEAFKEQMANSQKRTYLSSKNRD
ncbi:TIGR03826 family flagellar region protein [Jeotgalibacillus soli]|uniref:Membrane protein n=1 Tax=Jeotgalibacillus soli TaxID=889306 RepID=A0A0C2RIB9_9BACL|nr:TIGR03826 family flagellar region protein [Jeotgalibacillus soli]KIL49910.1 membrane protein [Jeotgalibacillus soli]